MITRKTTSHDRGIGHLSAITADENVTKSIDIFTSPDKVYQVTGTRLKNLTEKIKQLDQAGKLFIRHHHIEKERIYRGISLEHVQRVLRTGKVTRVRESDSSVLWQGPDADGRLLELNCTLKDEDGNITVVVGDATIAIVGTAYDPSEKDDDALKARWLNDHPDYEDAGKRKGVQKKIEVTRK